MKTWTAHATTTKGSPGGRDQARPLQSKDGTWFQMMGCGGSKGAAVCRFRATDTTLSNWTFSGMLFQSNTTWSGVGGNFVNFYEVPDFYPLTSASGTTKHVLVTDPWAQGGPGGAGYHVHNVEWRSGVWSDDGSRFKVEKTACLDYVSAAAPFCCASSKPQRSCLPRRGGGTRPAPSPTGPTPAAGSCPATSALTSHTALSQSAAASPAPEVMSPAPELPGAPRSPTD